MLQIISTNFSKSKISIEIQVCTNLKTRYRHRHCSSKISIHHEWIRNISQRQIWTKNQETSAISYRIQSITSEVKKKKKTQPSLTWVPYLTYAGGLKLFLFNLSLNSLINFIWDVMLTPSSTPLPLQKKEKKETLLVSSPPLSAYNHPCQRWEKTTLDGLCWERQL